MTPGAACAPELDFAADRTFDELAEVELITEEVLLEAIDVVFTAEAAAVPCGSADVEAELLLYKPAVFAIWIVLPLETIEAVAIDEVFW